MTMIKLLVSLNGRENGEKRTITPGFYNTDDDSFPELLRGETRATVVERPEGFEWEVVEVAETPEVEETEDVEEATEERPIRRKKKRV